MANKVSTAYGARANPDSASYPGGSFKNATTPNTGTPVEEKWQNDFLAFFQKLMSNAGLSYNETTDTVLVSQYFEALSTTISRGSSRWLDAALPDDNVILGGGGTFDVGGAALSGLVATIIQYNTTTYNAVVSANGGSIWERATTTNFDRPTAMAAGAGVFVVLSSGTGITTKALRSSDGLTWSESLNILSDDQEYADMVFDGTRFIAVLNDGYVNTSLDGITWNEISVSLPSANGLAHNGTGTIVAAGAPAVGTGERLMRSTNNGQSWTLISTPDDSIGYKGVAYGNGRWVAMPTESGVPTNDFAYSDDDGLTWTIGNTPLLQLNSLAYTPLGFIAPYTDNNTVKRVAISADGITWYDLLIPPASPGTEQLGRPFVDLVGRTYIGSGDRVIIGGA